MSSTEKSSTENTNLQNSSEINCAEACVNGCILGEQCPHRDYQKQAAKFIQETPLDQMLSMAEEALRKKMTAPPQWVYPEDL